MDYLKSKTVKELIEVCKRMGIAHSGMRKAELVQHVAFHVDAEHGEALALVAKTAKRNQELDKVFQMDDHSAALEMNEDIVRDDEFMHAGVLWTGPWATVLKAHDKMLRRFNPDLTRDKNGMVKLTPKQRRRIHKNDRRNSKRFGLEK